MKLLLASNGKFLIDEGYSLLGIPYSDMRVGYVITASVGDGSPTGRQAGSMNELGIFFEEIDIDGKTQNELRKFFSDKNIIHVEGGNTFYLLKKIRESGFDDVLKELIGKGVAYVGTSAGAYVMGVSVETATWKGSGRDRFGVADFTALGYAPFMVFAHYTDEMKDKIFEAKNKSKYPVKILRDGQAVYCHDDICEFVGSGEEVII